MRHCTSTWKCWRSNTRLYATYATVFECQSLNQYPIRLVRKTKSSRERRLSVFSLFYSESRFEFRRSKSILFLLKNCHLNWYFRWWKISTKMTFSSQKLWTWPKNLNFKRGKFVNDRIWTPPVCMNGKNTVGEDILIFLLSRQDQSWSQDVENIENVTTKSL